MIVFDFDGVLFDSLDEALLTATNSVTGQLYRDVAELPGSYLNLFRTNRYHVQPAGDFLPFAGWCWEHHSDSADKQLSIAEFKSIIEAQKEPLKERTARFFATRAKLIALDASHWVTLTPPYEPLWSRVKKLNAKQLHILTNKNLDAVLNLCANNGLMISPENVLSGDKGAATKEGNLRILQERMSDIESIQFVDDSIKNLLELKNSKDLLNTPSVNYILADWGYVGPDDAKLASSNQIPAFSQSDLLRLIDEIYP